MQVIRGTVSELRMTSQAMGGGVTVYTAVFRLDGRAVKFKSNTMPIMARGDDVVVAGFVRKGRLVAHAYRNHTTGSSGEFGFTAMFLTFVVGVGMGIYGLATFDHPSVSRVRLLFCGLFFSLSILSIYRVVITVWAINRLRDSSPSQPLQ